MVKRQHHLQFHQHAVLFGVAQIHLISMLVSAIYTQYNVHLALLKCMSLCSFGLIFHNHIHPFFPLSLRLRVNKSIFCFITFPTVENGSCRQYQAKIKKMDEFNILRAVTDSVLLPLFQRVSSAVSANIQKSMTLYCRCYCLSQN